MQSVIPKLIEAHWGSGWLQSQHTCSTHLHMLTIPKIPATVIKYLNFFQCGCDPSKADPRLHETKNLYDTILHITTVDRDYWYRYIIKTIIQKLTSLIMNKKIQPVQQHLHHL